MKSPLYNDQIRRVNVAAPGSSCFIQASDDLTRGKFVGRLLFRGGEQIERYGNTPNEVGDFLIEASKQKKQSTQQGA